MENQQKSQADHKVLGSMIDDFVTSALKKYAKSSHCRDNFDLLHHDLDLSESETSEVRIDIILATYIVNNLICFQLIMKIYF